MYRLAVVQHQVAAVVFAVAQDARLPASSSAMRRIARKRVT
jgi:hypothetical protein